MAFLLVSIPSEYMPRKALHVLHLIVHSQGSSQPLEIWQGKYFQNRDHSNVPVERRRPVIINLVPTVLSDRAHSTFDRNRLDLSATSY